MAEEKGFTEPYSKDPDTLLNGIYYTGDKGPRFGTRHTQIILMTIGMGLAMVTKTCFSLIYTSMTEQSSSNPDVPIYDWANSGVILGAVLWSGVPTQILGGYLGRLWGHKWLVLGLCIVDAIFFILIPASASTMGSTGVVVCRVVQGAAQGALAPMGAVLNGYWIPAEEWSSVGVIGIAGSIFIAILGTGSVGFITSSSLGWTWCFYIIGSFELLWCVLWFFFSHQTPLSHPNITPEEKKYIQVSLKQREKKKERTIPLKKILTSMPFYAIVVATIGTDWNATMQSTVTPSILQTLLDIDAKSRSIVMMAGPILGIFAGIAAAKVSNLIIKKNIVRRVNARRLFHSIGSIGNGILVVLLTFVPPGNVALVTLTLCVGNIFIVLYAVGGSGVNTLDISPVFAGFVTGVANMFAHGISLFGPLLYDWIVIDKNSPSEWRILMSVTFGIALVTTIFFDIFTTDKRQEHWEEEEESDEMND